MVERIEYGDVVYDKLHDQLGVAFIMWGELFYYYFDELGWEVHVHGAELTLISKSDFA